MCGNSSRLSTGGTIAVLRPPPHESPASPVANCNLFFENPAGRTASTRVVFQAQDGSCFDHFMGYFMLIQ